VFLRCITRLGALQRSRLRNLRGACYQRTPGRLSAARCRVAGRVIGRVACSFPFSLVSRFTVEVGSRTGGCARTVIIRIWRGAPHHQAPLAAGGAPRPNGTHGRARWLAALPLKRTARLRRRVSLCSLPPRPLPTACPPPPPPYVVKLPRDCIVSRCESIHSSCLLFSA